LTLTDEGLRPRTDYPDPVLMADEALVRVRLAGVCATDLELMAGYQGGFRGVLGHEFVGEVVDAPEMPEWIGRRVVGEINIGCGDCALCRRGLGRHCRTRQVIGIHARDGAFAEYIAVPTANLHDVPETVDDETAVFTEPLAAALEILEQVHIEPDSVVVVVGDGRLGLLCAQALALTGCKLTMVGRHAAKLAHLQGMRGVRTLLADPATLTALADEPADVVVEATGSPDGFALARRLVRPAGTLVMKSTYAGGLANFDVSRLVVDEVSVVGSRCGPFAPALRLLEQGLISVKPLIEARYGLERAVEAIEYAGRKGVLKVVIAP
jgi:threonine dehydrogenase-like Zn-dependent dehydrogenase